MALTKTPPNKSIFQTFEWHTPSTPPATDRTHAPISHYARLLRVLPLLCDVGITSLWLPPGCKANNPDGNGYDCYDIWDLGEYDSKFARSTKWGSVEELRDLIRAAHDCQVEIIWDAVLNHKTSGDTTEECWAVEVDPEDRRVEICPPKKIVAWLKYEFPGRGTQHSSLRWRAEHFNGTDWDQARERHAIYKLIDDPASYPKPELMETSRGRSVVQRLLGNSKKAMSSLQKRPGKGWAEDVSRMHGNYDYLLFSNIDHTHPAVRDDILRWGEWMLESTSVDGFRLDAVQHFSYGFTREWITRMQACRRKRLGSAAFIVGEVWSPNVGDILEWLDAVPEGTYAFDSPLVYSFSRLSEAVLQQDRRSADLRNITKGTLVACRPHAAVTVVSNHDTQTGQASFVPMDAQLKTLFYAFILLRVEGQPCVFWGDLFGIRGQQPEPPACRDQSGRSLLADLILARQLVAYGAQKEIVSSAECLMWTRSGCHDRPGCVVMISIKTGVVSKRMAFGRPGDTWVDLLSLGLRSETTIDERGFGDFSCLSRTAAVYVRRDDTITGRFPAKIDFSIAD